MAEAAALESRPLQFTPTWAVATVCSVFIAIGFIVIFAFEKTEHYLKQADRKPLVSALEKIKEEFMLLGIISLLLTVCENYVASICVKASVLNHWTPCHMNATEKAAYLNSGDPAAGGAGRRLFSFDSWPMIDWVDEPLLSHGRILTENVVTKCKPGHEPIVSIDSLHELHIFIFVLACVHLIYSLFAMLLASLKVKGWRGWEKEAQKDTRDDLHRQSTFIKLHAAKPWSKNPVLVWAGCFFRQFGQSVTRSDYLTLRLGFIVNHNTGNKFDFHSYMIRSLEDEFRKVVGISFTLWFFVVLFLLFNVAGSNLYFWLSLIPVVLVLLIGTKLNHIITTLALENAGITQGGPSAGTLLKPRDELFWFSKPELILFLIHFMLFQNAFEMATFIGFVWSFGIHSCYLKNKAYVYVRIGVGVIVQILCSYSTLPLYAIVTQMGSHYKQAIFQSHVQDRLYHWRKDAKRRVKHGSPHQHEGVAPDGSPDGDEWSEDNLSPVYVGSEHDMPMPPAENFKDNSSSNDANHRARFETGAALRPVHGGPVLSPLDIPLSAVELSRTGTENDGKPLYRSVSSPPKLLKSSHSSIIPKAPVLPFMPPRISKSLKEKAPRKSYKHLATAQPEEDVRPPEGSSSHSFRHQPS